MSRRLPDFQLSEADERQKQVLESILNGPRGNLNGPFIGWIHSPELAQHAQELGAFCRYKTGLSLRLSELAIMVTAARWKSQAEWYIHHPIAVDAGIPDELLEAIRCGLDPDFTQDDDQLIYTFVTELYENKRVSASCLCVCKQAGQPHEDSGARWAGRVAGGTAFESGPLRLAPSRSNPCGTERRAAPSPGDRSALAPHRGRWHH